MEKIKLDPETSALILIDLQHGIVALETRPHPASAVVAKAATLAATFRKNSSPVIYIRVDLANMLQVPADRSHGDSQESAAVNRFGVGSGFGSTGGRPCGDQAALERFFWNRSRRETQTSGREDGCNWGDNDQLRSRVNRPGRCGFGLWHCVR